MKCEACGEEIKEGEEFNQMTPHIRVHGKCYAEYSKDMEEFFGRPDDVG